MFVLASIAGSQLPQGFASHMNLVYDNNQCGSWLASDGGRTGAENFRKGQNFSIDREFCTRSTSFGLYAQYPGRGPIFGWLRQVSGRLS